MRNRQVRLAKPYLSNAYLPGEAFNLSQAKRSASARQNRFPDKQLIAALAKTLGPPQYPAFAICSSALSTSTARPVAT